MPVAARHRSLVPARRAAVLLLSAAAAAGPVPAEPRRPASDAEVVETLPMRPGDPRSMALAVLRRDWQRDPRDLAAALAFAQASFDLVAADGDPRHLGHAQAALAPWWTLPEPPVGVRVLRALLAQFDHRFDDALADLDAALRAEPANAQAWAWRAAIQLVRADYPEAARSCEGLARHAPALVGQACRAQVQAVTGRAGSAAATLRAALQAAGPAADTAQRAWVLTRLAETEERRGERAAAEAAFRQALALGVDDVYLQAAYADFLLDAGRPAEVLALLKGRGRADVLLLRQAIAARATGDAQAGVLAAELAARFAAAKARGDSTHRKEEARFLVALGPPDPPALRHALSLAVANFAQQREPADARVLLEAALAARDPAAAAPALRWLAESSCEGPALARLAAQLGALPAGAAK
jgi:tetratricopeptide (TPR) repeat protein